MSENRLDKRIRAYLNQGMRNGDVVDAVLGEIALDTGATGLADWIGELVTGQVHRLHRQRTRLTERAAGPISASPGLLSLQSADQLLARKQLLREGMFTPTFGYVTFGEAESHHYRDRIEYLESQIGGIRRTVRFLKNCLKTIESAGVTCLNDLAEEAA